MKSKWMLSSITFLFLISIFPGAGFSKDPVRFYLFYFGEPMKTKMEREILQPLSETFPIEIQSFPVNLLANHDLLVKFEKELKAKESELPAVIIGDKILGGEAKIKRDLKGLITFYVQKGGTSWPSLKEVPIGEIHCIPDSQEESLPHPFRPGHDLNKPGMDEEECL